MRFRTFQLPLCALVLLSPVFPCLAAGSSIDPDPRSLSLSDLLQREDDARARAAAKAVPVVPEAEMAPKPEALAKPTPSRPGAVRQVYPSPYAAGAVTVLVPGGRLPAPAR